MEAERARRAVSDECRALVDRVGTYAEADVLSLSERLHREGVDRALIAEALTQARLREAAVPKFGEFAAAMAFSQEGLEQATRLPVAALHARRFRDAGCTSVFDATAGIGADSMALSALGMNVTACEKDEGTAILADFNLRHWDSTDTVHADATAVAHAIDADALWADPARRDARGRRHDPRDYTPTLEQIFSLGAAFPGLGIKVGPGIPHSAVPTDCEAQWLSVDGAVVEAALWRGTVARGAGHRALVIRHGTAHEIGGSTAPGEAGPLGTFLAEPDGAVIRAGLVGVFADSIDAHLIDPTIAYLSSDTAVVTPFARWYRLLEVLPLDIPTLAAALRARGVGSVDIKKRGVDVTPERLRPQLKLSGDERGTVILTRVAGRRSALIVEPFAPN